jgi:hypothetical protein
MDEAFPEALHHLDQNGFVLLPAIFAKEEALAWADSLHSNLAKDLDEGVKRRSGSVVAARNVEVRSPEVRTLWRRPPLTNFLHLALGKRCGLVRTLYFDKPPGRSWTLPMHRDTTIAVKAFASVSGRFSKPTTKAGVTHLEAPAELLERMLTLRVFLDANTPTNGPLKIVAGSHREAASNSRPTVASQEVHGDRGDVLAMRPLLLHGSGRSAPFETARRRTLHLEFAADPILPEGLEWNEFCPLHDGGV